MIKEKFQKFLIWLKDHFLFLLEVVVRLSVGLREENKDTKTIDERRIEDDE